MPDRTSAPALQHTLELSLPSTYGFLERPGLQGIVIPSDRQQVVHLEILFRAGVIHEPATGIAGFTAGMLDKGTTDKSAAEVAGLLDFYSAQLNFSHGADYCTLSVYCLTRNLKYILPLVSEILTSPAFEEEELRISRDIYLENLAVNLEKNSFVASKNLKHLVYGTHPYGRHLSKEDAEAITSGQLKDFFKSRYRAFKVFVSGAVEPADLETISGLLPESGNSPDTGLPVPVFAGPASHRTEKQGAVQCSIRMGKPCPGRLAQEYPALVMANHILGGFFGSRLMKNIREEKGLTYGIHASIQHLMQGSMQGISADVNKEKLEPALEAIRQELAGMREVSADELSTARRHFIGSMQNDLNTIFAGAEYIRTIRLNGLPEDYYSGLIQSLDKLTPDEISASAGHYMDPDSFAIAVAG